jgi:hypothetical protein
MPTSDSTAFSLETAQNLLRQFICIERLPADAIPDRSPVRQALFMVREHSDHQIFGICADTLEQAIATLTSYLNALGYETAPSLTALPAIAGPAYLKYNPKTARCHADTYIGEHRGVLVSCQSAYDGDVNETFGHLPLDLFHMG